MPDYTSLSLTIGPNVLDTLHGAPDGEKLLVPRDLSDAAVENSEAADQVEEPLGATEGVDGAVLGGDGAVALRRKGFKMGARFREVAGVDSGGFGNGEWAVYQGVKAVTADRRRRGSGGGIAGSGGG